LFGVDSDSRIGLLAYLLDQNKTIYEKNSDQNFVPASNMKLFTTATALEKLGSDFRYKTDFYISNNVLYIKGGGDPTISDRFYSDYKRAFYPLIESIKEHNITHIDKIVLDISAFGNESLGVGWNSRDFNECFSAPFGALSINENCLKIETFVDNRVPYVSIYPHNNYTKVINYLKLTNGKSNIKIYRQGDYFEVKDFINPTSKHTYKTPIHNPTVLFGYTIANILNSNQIETKESFEIVSNINSNEKDYNYISSIYSTTLDSIIPTVNKDSNNFLAEMIFRTLGYKFALQGNTTYSSKVLLNSIQDFGITGNISIYDGSGLSKYNLVTPRQFVTLLDYMNKSKNFHIFSESLPIFGIDGTLKKRTELAELTNKIRAKTGTLNNTKTLSGYLDMKNGQKAIFSLLSNNVPNQKSAKLIQDNILMDIMNYGISDGNINSFE
jgi:D-alanyl-D-alanine carboxypeptidase/D-alanyl-D-alanine-endopeptidase (penicillin-binding protein 4)